MTKFISFLINLAGLVVVLATALTTHIEWLQALAWVVVALNAIAFFVILAVVVVTS